MTARAPSHRILFLINSLSGGGAERVMIALLSGSRDRMPTTTFSLALLDDEEDAYTPPAWLPLERLSTGGSLVRGFRAVRALVRRERPDAIVSFLTRANVIATVVGRIEGIPVVISERVNTSAHLGGRRAAIQRLMVRLSYPRADKVIAVSRGVADDLAAHFSVRAAQIATIANPVDLAGIEERASAAAAVPLEVPFIVAVGRLTTTKNMILLVRAYAEADPGSRLLILGDGPERAALSAEIDRLRLAGRVVLGGFASNPFAILRHARAYVSASNGEGFPNALVEAMALGLPVIATNCASGPSEILADRPREAVTGVLDTPHGRLVPANDQSAMAEALRRFDTMPATELATMGGHARARAQEYSVERAVYRYWEVINSVAARGARREAAR